MIRPLFRFVLIDPDTVKVNRNEVTKAGLYIPTKKDERPDLATATGTVLAIGELVTMVQPGDKVIYNYFSGNSIVTFGNESDGSEDVEKHMVFEGDLLGVTEDDAKN